MDKEQQDAPKIEFPCEYPIKVVGRAGPVFTVQVSYLVTGFGILWAKLILGEAYPSAVWGALALMFLGMYLVQPRSKAALAPA